MEIEIQAIYKEQLKAAEFALKRWRAKSQANWRADLLEEANARHAALCEPVIPCRVHFSRTRYFNRLHQLEMSGAGVYRHAWGV